MTSERDPALESLFAVAREYSPDDGFTADVMSQVDRRRRRALVAWAFLCLFLVAAAAMLAGPVSYATGLMGQVLPDSLVHIDDRWTAQVLAPINSIAGAVGIGFLLLRLAYRKLFA